MVDGRLEATGVTTGLAVAVPVRVVANVEARNGCPRCSTPPPFDPFLCTTCGEHLLTYLDEPFGPGSGIRREPC